MDILNFISWIRGRRQVTLVDPAKTLIPIGLKDGRRDDEYLAGAITVQDLAAQIAPPPVNIYNSDGTLTSGRNINGNGNELTFSDLFKFELSALNAVPLSLLYDNNGSLRTSKDGIPDGLWISPLFNVYRLGQFSNVGTIPGTYIEIDANLKKIDLACNRFTIDNSGLSMNSVGMSTYFNNVTNGFSFNKGTRVYRFGQINGNNTTSLTISDTETYPIQLTGVNISANTAGTASGEFLKIKVNGVDYKIALLNP